MRLASRALIIFLSIILFTQVSEAILPGAKMGVHYGNASRSPDEKLSTEIEPGYIVGATIDFPLAESKLVRGRIEAMWVQKGWREEGIIDEYGYYGISYEGSAYVNEFVFAALVHIRLTDKKATPYFVLGPEMGFKDKVEIKVKADNAYFTLKDDIPDWKDANPSFNIGAGLVFPVGKCEALCEVRYNFGLINLYDGDTNLFGSTAPEVRLNGVQLTFGFQIGQATGG